MLKKVVGKRKTSIPIYSIHGKKIDEITIEDKIKFDTGRTSIGEKYYYKGAGTRYSHHFTWNKNDSNIVGPSSVFYAGYVVTSKALKGKTGIINIPFQPYFSDWIGACGPKEEKILINSKKFEKSGIEVIDKIEIDKDNRQSYYVLRYKTERNKFSSDGQVSRLQELLYAMHNAAFNFPWDKASIEDITKDGYVTDVSDLFESQELSHQFGSIYSVFHSLQTLYPTLYYTWVGDKKLPVIAAFEFMEKIDTRIKDFVAMYNSRKQQIIAMYKLLIEGKPCGGLENPVYEIAIRNKYKELLLKRIKNGKI